MKILHKAKKIIAIAIGVIVLIYVAGYLSSLRIGHAYIGTATSNRSVGGEAVTELIFMPGDGSIGIDGAVVCGNHSDLDLKKAFIVMGRPADDCSELWYSRIEGDVVHTNDGNTITVPWKQQ